MTGTDQNGYIYLFFGDESTLRYYWTGITELRHVFQMLYMSYRAYTYLTDLILVLQNLIRYITIRRYY